MREKYKKNFFNNFQKSQNFFRILLCVKNFKRSLISISKCIELNSELILVLDWGLDSQPGPRPNKYLIV